ncbi:hypothetical protein RDABS01_006127 [Bienertia sinuspersici]
MRQPWKHSLIIKMFDKTVGYMTLMRRLSRKWRLKGDFSLTDIGYAYYVARFTNAEDYNHVLTGGPWMIDDHYLTIRKWVPNFIPDNEPIKVLTAWVRIPNLAVEYFDTKFLHKVGSNIGKVIKIDKTTAAAKRGQFTKLCIELDLTKPLLSKFWLKGKIWKIQYEGLKLICYNCGKINHKDEECPELVANKGSNPEDLHVLPSPNATQHAAMKANPEETADFGSWMLVKKPTRTKAPNKTRKGAENSGQDSNPVSNKFQNLKANKAGGSRFEILDNASNIQGDDKEVTNDIATNQGEKLAQDLEAIQISSNGFETVSLGDMSQNQTTNNKEIPAFALGKAPISSEKKRSSNQARQRKALDEKDCNIIDVLGVKSDSCNKQPTKPFLFADKHKLVQKPSSTQAPEKTSQLTIPIHQATQKPSSETQLEAITKTTPATTSQAHNHEHPDQTDSPRMVSLCGETDGHALHGHIEPPDPLFRSSNNDMARATPGAAGDAIDHDHTHEVEASHPMDL